MPEVNAGGRFAGFLFLLSSVAGCARRDSPRPIAREEWAVPGGVQGADCADVGDLSACWGGACPGVCVSPRVVPEAPPPTPLGWRCDGQGAERRCVDRARTAPPFACDGRRCVQKPTRAPDDGEWTCVDLAGVVVCLGGDPPAGVAPAPRDPAFVCEPRRPDLADGGPRETVCVDPSPDFPDGAPAGWRCRYSHEGGLARSCERDATVHVVGDACDPQRPCVDGARCAQGRCVPDRVRPACWLDRDCGAGRCKLGACAEPGT